MTDFTFSVAGETWSAAARIEQALWATAEDLSAATRSGNVSSITYVFLGTAGQEKDASRARMSRSAGLAQRDNSLRMSMRFGLDRHRPVS